MLRNKPKLTYCGLTVILANPARNDDVRLLTSTGGHLFNELLQPEFNQMQCDIRLMEDKSPWLDGTKCILLLGEAAMHGWIPSTSKNTLNEIRGTPQYIGEIPAMCSFFPQDAADFKNHEQRLNPLSKDYQIDEREDDDDADQKSHSKTKRANFAFWLSKDIEKCKGILFSKSGKWVIEPEPIYRIYPPADEVISMLEAHVGDYLEFDTETDLEGQNLLCFAFTFVNIEHGDWHNKVWSVPVLNHEYKWSYSTLPHILIALAKAIERNTLVAHNGACFDFFNLCYKYNIPIYKCYDTMMAFQRCYPTVEKSLGHCMSLFTNQPFHKDTDSFAYRTHEHLMTKLKYCAKDVFGMTIVHRAIIEFAKTIPGLQASIDCAMRSIRPYIMMSLQGIRYDENKVEAIVKENDELMFQYNRIIEMLIGDTGLVDVRKAVKGKAKLFAGSNAQCCRYFHDMLGYNVVARSEKTQKPSLGKKALYKLALHYDNPVITLVNMYRAIQIETSKLRSVPWKDNDNKIVDWRAYEEMV